MSATGAYASEGCPDTHFSDSLGTARTALQRTTGPRFAYVPTSVDPDSDSSQLLCRLVCESLLELKDQEDQMGFAAQRRDSALDVLTCIDAKIGDVSLPSLDFVYVGHPGDAEAARQLVESWGASFLFRADLAAGCAD